MNRRQLLTGSLLAAFFGALPVGANARRKQRAPAGTGAAAQPSSLPWRNWSGAQSAQPSARFVPNTEAALAAFLRDSKTTMRPVGAGHSFSGLVPTSGALIVADELTGLLASDAHALTATFGAGTRLSAIGAPLDAIDQAMFNLPDIDRQMIAGAIATATHGTGIAFTSLSSYVKGLRLITPGGAILDLDAQAEPRLFAAARVNLGALGVITRVTLRNRASFRLKETAHVAKTEDVLEGFDAAIVQHRHYEMFPLVHSDYALVQAIDKTKETVDNPAQTPEEAAAFDGAMAAWRAAEPSQRRALINGTVMQIPPTVRVDASYKVLANVRNTRFNEMEYSVPIDNGAACLREILKTIADKQIDVVFPMEYRYVSGDDLWLSMFSGGPRAAISVHQFADIDYRPYFSLIEPIFWKYGGRPHWGKVHTLEFKQLRALYPHFEEFLDVRAQVDPHGKMLNDYLRRLFGVDRP